MGVPPWAPLGRDNVRRGAHGAAMLEIRADIKMKPGLSRSSLISANVTALAGREGRLSTGGFVPVTEFGLRGWRR